MNYKPLEILKVMGKGLEAPQGIGVPVRKISRSHEPRVQINCLAGSGVYFFSNYAIKFALLVNRDVDLPVFPVS